MTDVVQVSKVRCFDGWQYVFKHPSETVGCEMTFGVYIPDHKQNDEKLPTLFYLSGLTCTHANFIEKSGFQRFASKHRFIVVNPDTSPRNVNIPGEDDSWDFGSGAGFYVNATAEPWSKHYRMYSYVVEELPQVAAKVAPIDNHKMGIFGHSMGGHGALVIGLRNPQLFKSISAFSPISNPTSCAWGIKALTGYLGEDKSKWADYDASLLLAKYDGPERHILADQGAEDDFLKQDQLRPEALKSTSKVQVEVRMQPEHGHSYYFISTFIEDHFTHFAKQINH
ncbi:hypothetical protein WR25_08072 isoform A [Diploscapter pachys]|uniref:S-formylglutathione hydrolase n=1 Tax=Diploscapter pachys TaxID=2018661 RepID=A0A2A2J4V5_9BILA|nr:hypothetical protein WR25_08072 isoform A [Diploscapter pachys]